MVRCGIPPPPPPQIPLICETKPMISIQQMMAYQKNGGFQPSPMGLMRQSEPNFQDVARIRQLEEGVRPIEKKRSSHLHRRPEPKDKDHCAIDMNGLETNV